MPSPQGGQCLAHKRANAGLTREPMSSQQGEATNSCSELLCCVQGCVLSCVLGCVLSCMHAVLRACWVACMLGCVHAGLRACGPMPSPQRGQCLAHKGANV